MHVIALLRSSLLFSSRMPLAMLGSAASHHSHSDIQLQGEDTVSDAIVIRVFDKTFVSVQLASGKLEPTDVLGETRFR